MRLLANNPTLLLIVAVCVIGVYVWQQQTASAAQAEPSVVPSAHPMPDAPTAEPLPSDQKQTRRTKTQKQKTQKPTRPTGIEIPAYLTDRPEEIVQHEGFTLSYNKAHLVPNWVAWVLTAERTRGTEKRSDNFQPDFDIKKGPIAYTEDYRGSGYDRGHMCPAADCKHNRQAMNDCFLMSNMCPQSHELNAGDWEALESRCRRWAVAYDSIFIVCGPIFDKDVIYESIGRNGVTVPQRFFKVILRKTWDGAEAIGFIMNNTDEHRRLADYAVSVDEVEACTGINFFSKLDKNIERKAEAACNTRRWQGL